MIDIKFLRENPDIVKQNIKNKFQDKKLPLVDEVIELDKERRESQAAAYFCGSLSDCMERLLNGKKKGTGGKISSAL